MPTSPTNIVSPANWTSTITDGTADGFAIRWVAQTGFALAPGGSLSGFAFDSTTTAAQMAGPSQFFNHPPVATTVVYSGAPFSDAGFTFVVTATPEPSTWLTVAPAGGWLVSRKRARS